MKIICIIVCLLALAACSGTTASDSQSSEAEEVIATPVVLPADSVETVEPPQPEAALSTETEYYLVAQTEAGGERFQSVREAFDEGYSNGYQEGYTDAIHHLEFGYNYDDEPEYSGFLKSYIAGYEKGYFEGFHEGVEWNREND